MVADVAYDMFLGWNPTDSNSYEIMVWGLQKSAVRDPLVARATPLLLL